MNKILGLLLAIFSQIWFFLPLLGQKMPLDAPVSSIRALIVGVSHYQEIPDLQFGHSDAMHFHVLLEKVFPSLNSKILVNEEATHTAIQLELSILTANTQKGDTVIFFFSGHGDCETKLKGEPGFLLTHDTPSNNYLLDALRISDLRYYVETLVTSKKAHVLLFIDACRAGLAKEHDRMGPRKTAVSLMELFNKELLFLSCKPDQYSLEFSALGGGLFTYFLVRGMHGEADHLGNKNGEVHAEELRRYLFDSVMESSQFGQTPIFVGDPIKLLFKYPVTQNSEPLNLLPNYQHKFHRPQSIERAKGINETILDLSKDSIKPESIKERFLKALEKKQLIHPEGDNALYFYKQYLDDPQKIESEITIMQAQFLAVCRPYISEAIRKYIVNERKGLSPEIIRPVLRISGAALEILHPDDLQYKYFQSNHLFLTTLAKNGDLNSQIDSILRAIEIEPYAAYLYNELGNIHEQADQEEEAISAYTRASEIAPAWTIPQEHLRAMTDGIALNQEFSPLTIGIYLKPNQYSEIEVDQISKLATRILNLIIENGASANVSARLLEPDTYFSTEMDMMKTMAGGIVCFPKLEIFDIGIAELGSKKITIVDVSLTLSIQDIHEDIIFASKTITLQGSGSDEREAINNVLQELRPFDPQWMEFVNTARINIIEYYDKHCDAIIQKAKQLDRLGAPWDAIQILWPIPVEISCHEKVQKLVREVYQRAINQVCRQELDTVRIRLASNQYAQAIKHLRRIDPKSDCYEDVLKMLAELTKEIDQGSNNEKSYHLELKEYRVQIERERSNSIRIENTLAERNASIIKNGKASNKK